MKRFLYFVFLILIAATGCKEKSNDIMQDISGIYTVNFTGSYMIDTVVYTWSREQNMKISKRNGSLYNLCVCEHDSCIENTVTTVRVINTHEIAGNFCYEKTSKFDWCVDTLYGTISNENKVAIHGFFEAETVQKILVNSGPYSYPEYITIPVEGTFVFSKF